MYCHHSPNLSAQAPSDLVSLVMLSPMRVPKVYQEAPDSLDHCLRSTRL